MFLKVRLLEDNEKLNIGIDELEFIYINESAISTIYPFYYKDEEGILDRLLITLKNGDVYVCEIIEIKADLSELES